MWNCSPNVDVEVNASMITDTGSPWAADITAPWWRDHLIQAQAYFLTGVHCKPASWAPGRLGRESGNLLQATWSVATHTQQP